MDDLEKESFETPETIYLALYFLNTFFVTRAKEARGRMCGCLSLILH